MSEVTLYPLVQEALDEGGIVSVGGIQMYLVYKKTPTPPRTIIGP